jgi:hypothetical protein
MPTNDTSTQAHKATGPTVYRRLIHDHRVSHGAFRLWHYLSDRRNKNGQTWPNQRDIAAEIGCKIHSLTPWTNELVDAGYLATEKVGQKHNLRYTILPGNAPFAALPEWATRTGFRHAEKGNTEDVSTCPKRNADMPKGATPRHAQMGNLSNLQGVNAMSKGGGRPPGGLENLEAWKLAKDIERLRNAIKTAKESQKPDPDLIAADRAELKLLMDEKRRRGRVAIEKGEPTNPKDEEPARKPNSRNEGMGMDAEESGRRTAKIIKRHTEELKAQTEELQAQRAKKPAPCTPPSQESDFYSPEKIRAREQLAEQTRKEIAAIRSPQ